MAQISFGTILRNERERKGYDLESVARRLRIRPDILQALESSDFSRMPPRGYARNMVNAYAHFLGLNSTEITSMYLEEVYADQVRRARAKAPGTGFDMSEANRSRRSEGSRKSSTRENPDATVNSQGRVTMTHRNTHGYDGGTYERNYGRLNTESRTRPARASALGTQYTNLYSDSRNNGSIRSKLPLLLAGAAILVLLIILLVFLFAPKAESSDDIQKVPVTGVDDTTQNSGGLESEDTVTPIAVAPTRAVVEYSVANGQSAYIEVYVDDAVDVADTISGPSKGSYEVVGTLRFVTTNPEAVSVTQDGTKLELADSSGSGVYSVTIDFPAILAQWHLDHPQPTPTTIESSNTELTGDSN
ncbi:MAG: helix-turn-helix domain-containing protein [Raoultibacter sp.]|jgi:cytoskeleton protein RodZ